MNLLVLGAAGGCGRHLVSIAVQRGFQVTAVARPTTPLEVPPQAKVVRGDVLSPGFLDQVVEGHQVVLSAVGIKRANPQNPWSRLITPPDACSRSAQLLVEAMKKHGVARVMAISAAGVGDSYPALNGLMKFLLKRSNVGLAYRDLERMEEVFRQSGLDWQAVRPTRLTDGPRTNRAQVVEAFPTNAAISRADVAAFMLNQLEQQSFAPLRTPSITGG